jgi:hypothetical protein
MLDALSQTIERYRAWQAFNTTIPTMANRLAELRQLGRKIEPAYRGLRDLSSPTRTTLTSAPIDMLAARPANAGTYRTFPLTVRSKGRIDRAIDCAHSDLCELRAAIQRTIAFHAGERRGRKKEPVHILIRQLADIFFQFDRGDHDDDAARLSARNAFIQHVLKASDIPAPARLTQIVSKK